MFIFGQAIGLATQHRFIYYPAVGFVSFCPSLDWEKKQIFLCILCMHLAEKFDQMTIFKCTKSNLADASIQYQKPITNERAIDISYKEPICIINICFLGYCQPIVGSNINPTVGCCPFLTQCCVDINHFLVCGYIQLICMLNFKANKKITNSKAVKRALYHLTFSLLSAHCPAAVLKWFQYLSCLSLLQPLWHIEQRRFPCSRGEGRRAIPNLVPWKRAKISIGVIQISIRLECRSRAE